MFAVLAGVMEYMINLKTAAHAIDTHSCTLASLARGPGIRSHMTLRHDDSSQKVPSNTQPLQATCCLYKFNFSLSI